MSFWGRFSIVSRITYNLKRVSKIPEKSTVLIIKRSKLKFTTSWYKKNNFFFLYTDYYSRQNPVGRGIWDIELKTFNKCWNDKHFNGEWILQIANWIIICVHKVMLKGSSKITTHHESIFDRHCVQLKKVPIIFRFDTIMFLWRFSFQYFRSHFKRNRLQKMIKLSCKNICTTKKMWHT